VEPIYLAINEVVEIHKDQVARYGGAEGIRDVRLLQAAVAMPAACLGGQYLHTDLCEMTAAYLFHIVQNHPFTDGNKRVGAVAADVFLAMNEIRLETGDAEYEQLVMSVASGQMSKSGVAEFFRNNTNPL